MSIKLNSTESILYLLFFELFPALLGVKLLTQLIVVGDRRSGLDEISHIAFPDTLKENVSLNKNNFSWHLRDDCEWLHLLRNEGLCRLSVRHPVLVNIYVAKTLVLSQ